MTGVTPQGFVGKRLPQIRSEIEQAITSALGDVDLRAESVFGQQVGIHSEYDALLWQLAEDIYSSQYPDTATGVALDWAVSLNGITRIAATPTVAAAVVYGIDGTALPAGREASNRRTGAVYRSLAPTTISLGNTVYVLVTVNTVAEVAYTVTVGGVGYTYTAEDGDTRQDIITALVGALSTAPVTAVDTGSEEIRITAADPVSVALTENLTPQQVGTPLEFRAIDNGAQILAVGDLTQIETPVSGWQRVDNLVEGVIGTDRETDGELRLRRRESISITATDTLSSITASVRQLSGVTDANVLANNGTVTDSFGTPRQHIWAIVEGGEDQDIGNVIFGRIAGGIGMRGDVEVEVTSQTTGRAFDVRFDRPDYIDPIIVVEYTVRPGFPADGEQRIIDALVQYGQDLVMGQTLIYSRLYTPINSVPGVQVDVLTVDGAELNIDAEPNEKIRLLIGNITVTESE